MINKYVYDPSTSELAPVSGARSRGRYRGIRTMLVLAALGASACAFAIAALSQDKPASSARR